MAPRKRRSVGRVKGFITPPPTSICAVNTRGFTTLADEIYLEIVSYMPSVPIPTSIDLESYPEIRRSRHETFLSLSQTSRSLRRFFWRYLWQRIEVREGMKFGGKYYTLNGIRTRTTYLSDYGYAAGHKEYAIELVRQLEIVTIRNPLLAQYVNYLDIFIGEYSFETVLSELARCLSLFQNLHTVQIDVKLNSSRLEIFQQTFKKYSYPQIRNVFVTVFGVSFIASCPQARRVGFTRYNSMSKSCLKTIQSCPHLEVLDFGVIFWTNDVCNFIVNTFPNLRTIQFVIDENRYLNLSRLNIHKELNHLQTIIIRTPPPIVNVYPTQEQRARTERVKEGWIKSAKQILNHIQLRDNLEKTVVVLDYDGNERRIVIKPKFSFDLDFLKSRS